MMWTFQDKGNRDVCLIPEVTGIVQETYGKQLTRETKKLFYVSRCYRYDRPQAGRYREFTQVGVEFIGKEVCQKSVVELLTKALDLFGLDYRFVPTVKRGLSYYLEDGFEVECDRLGAQKQIAGGGRYAEGVGWAIGLDRLLIATGV